MMLDVIGNALEAIGGIKSVELLALAGFIIGFILVTLWIFSMYKHGYRGQ